MAVRIRMKKMGRTHRPFFRVCAFDQNAPRDGRALEELGTYDPSVPDTDARAVLNGERIAYWMSVGAQPSEKVAVLIKKYGANGTHLEKQQAALAKLAEPKSVPEPGTPASTLKKSDAPQPSGDAASGDQPSEASAEPAQEQAQTEAAEPAAEAPPEEAPAGEATSEEAKAEE